MRLGAWIKALFASEDPAAAAYERLQARVEVLETAFHELKDDNEDVIERIRSWSAREAGKRRHEAKRNLDEMIAAAPASTPDEGEVPPEVVQMSQAEATRARRKAEISRQFRRGA